MFEITIPAKLSEEWDESKEEFVYKIIGKKQILQLEHSLLSISKWESKWHKPFLYNLEKGTLSYEETIYYIECMTLTKNIDPDIYNFLTKENIDQICAYISDPMTATTIPKSNTKTNNREILTSELIYYYMLENNIPIECEKWHLNRLITLIHVFNFKNQPAKKMSKGEIMRRNTELNAERRKQLNTKG